MTKKEAVQIFEDKKVRTIWDSDQEKWYFSIIDVIAVLTESVDPNAYWRKLKQRLKKEGNETVTNCHGLKMLAKVARKELEAKTGKKVVSPVSAKKMIGIENNKDKADD